MDNAGKIEELLKEKDPGIEVVMSFGAYCLARRDQGYLIVFLDGRGEGLTQLYPDYDGVYGWNMEDLFKDGNSGPRWTRQSGRMVEMSRKILNHAGHESTDPWAGFNRRIINYFK